MTTPSHPFPETEQLSSGGLSSPIFNIIRIDNMPRFLTKLCDQVLALVSVEHERMLVLENEDANLDNDPEVHLADDSDRLFQFKVQQTIQQEETASAGEGFKVLITMEFPD